MAQTDLARAATFTPTPCINTTITTISPSTALASADKCGTSNSFFATGSDGGIALLTGGSPNFASAAFSNITVYNPPQIKAPSLNAIASECCMGFTQAWAVGAKHTILFNSGASGPTTPWVVISNTSPDNIALLNPASTDFLGVDVGGCGDVWITGTHGVVIHHLAGFGPTAGWVIVNPPSGPRLPNQDKLAIKRIPANFFGLGCPSSTWIIVAGKATGGTNDQIYLSTDGGNTFIAESLGVVSFNSGTTLRALDVLNNGSVYAVGDNGVIMWGTINGTCTDFIWTQQASGTTAQLNAINGSSPAGLLVAGNGGTITEFNGSVWTSGNIGSNINLSAVGQDTSGNGFVTCQCMVVVSIVCPPFFLPPQITNSPTFTDTPTPTPPVTAISTTTPFTIFSPSFSPTPNLGITNTPGPGGNSPTPTPPIFTTPSPGIGSATVVATSVPGSPLPSPTLVGVGPPPGPGCCGHDFIGVPTLVQTISVPSDLDCPGCGGPPGYIKTNYGEVYKAIANIICKGLPGTWAVGNAGVVRLWYGGTYGAYSLPFGPGPLPNFSAVTVPKNGVVWIGGSNGQIFMGTAVGNSCTNYQFVAVPSPDPNMRITNIKVDVNTGRVVITGVDQTTGMGLVYSAILAPGGGVPAWSSFLSMLPINPAGLNHVLETTPGNYWMVGNGGLILNDPNVNNPAYSFTAPAGLPATVQVGSMGVTVSVPLSSIDFRDVEAVNANHLFVVGTQGVVLEDLNGVWTQIAVGETTSNLNKIAIDANNEIVFIGDNATVLTYNGSTVYCLCQGLGSDNILDICGHVVCMGGFLTYINPSQTLCGFIATPPAAICVNQPATFQLEYVNSFVLDPTFTGVVSLFDSKDAATVFNPNPVIFTPADNGVVTFQATFSSVGQHTVAFTSNMCTVTNTVDVMVDHCYTATSTETRTFTTTPTSTPSSTKTPTFTTTPSVSPSFSVSPTFSSTFTITPTFSATPIVCISCGSLPQTLTLRSMTNCPGANPVVAGPLCVGSYKLRITGGWFIEGQQSGGQVFASGAMVFYNSVPSIAFGGFLGCVGVGGFGSCGLGAGPGLNGSWLSGPAALAEGQNFPFSFNITVPNSYLVVIVADNGIMCSDNFDVNTGNETLETLELTCDLPTPTSTDSRTCSMTPTSTGSFTATATKSPTRTSTGTFSASSTKTETCTPSPTFTISASRTQTRTSTSTPTASPTRTASATATPTTTCGIPAGSACCFTQPAPTAVQQLPGMTLPVSVATDCGGFVYAVDATGVLTGVIRKFDSSGNPVVTPPFPITLPYVDFSTQIAFDCLNGRILVTDPSTGNVLRFDGTTGASLPAFGPFPNIVGLAVDTSGNIYVGTGDGTTGAVTSLTSSGVVRWATSLTGGSGSAFQYPSTLAVDSVSHVLYVSDNGSGFIQSFGNINTSLPSVLFNITGFGSSTSAIAWNPLNNVLLVAQLSIAPPFSTLDPNLNMICGGFACFTGPRGGRSLAIGPFNGYAYAIFDTECCPTSGASIWVPCALPPTTTSTVTPTPTFSSTRTVTVTPSATPTRTSTATASPTFTTSATVTSSATQTPTLTATPTFTNSASPTPTATMTSTFTGTPTFSVTSSGTPTLTATPSWTATVTETPIPPPCVVCPTDINITGVSLDPNATPGTGGEQCIIATVSITGPTGCQITLEAHEGGGGMGNIVQLGTVTLSTSPKTGTFSFCTKANNLVISAVLGGVRCIDSNQVSLSNLDFSNFVIIAWDPPANGPITVNAGQPFSLSVTAMNSHGRIMTSYAGTVHFSIVPSAGTIDTLPPDTSFSPSVDHGFHMFFNECSISTVGSFNIVVSDASNPAMQGTSNLIIVEAPTLTLTPVGPSPTASSTPAPTPATGAGSCSSAQTCYQIVGTVGAGLSPGDPGYLQYPFGLAVTTDVDGNVYVLDQQTDQVKKFDSSGSFILEFAGHGSTDGLLQGAFMIAVDSASNVYVTDDHHINKFTSTGTFIIRWGSFGFNPDQFEHPGGIAVSPAGDVYVTDDSTHKVVRFNSVGGFIQEWGDGGDPNYGSFSNAEGVAVDGQGDVYIADLANQRILKFTFDGVYITQWATAPSDYPWGVAADTCGDIYEADQYGLVLHKYTSSGALIANFGDLTGGPDSYLGTIGVALDGSVYAAVSNNQVVKYGACTLFAARVNLSSSPVHSHLRRSREHLAPSPTRTPVPSLLDLSAAHVGAFKQGEQMNPYASFVSADKPVVTVPNPAKNNATVAYRLESAGKVRLNILTLDGSVIMDLALGDQPAGVGTADLYLGNLSSGLYFAVLQVDEGMGYRAKKAFKMAIVK